tara:strand:- start:974 stop:1192 length:219 start_codon:yes stop_codon:yes gene_type:complete
MLFNLFKRNLKPPKLGRWKVGETMDIVVKKAGQATDDHCGSGLCNKKYTEKKHKKDEKGKPYEFDPLLPFCM